MKFFQSFFKILSAVGSAAAVLFSQKLIEFFQGSQPSDVSAIVWAIVGSVGVLLVNYIVGKIPAPAA